MRIHLRALEAFPILCALAVSLPAAASPTFFGRPLPSSLTPGMRALMQRGEALAVGRGVSWTAPEALSTGGGGWHARHQAFDLGYCGNPFIMHENGERALDHDLGPVYSRIAGLVLNHASIIPATLLSVRPRAGTQRTWKRTETITVAALYDLLKAESDAMKRYFELLRPAASADLGRTIATHRASAFGRANPRLINADAAAQRQVMMADYLTLGGTKAHLAAIVGQSVSALHVASPPARPRANGRPSDRPFAIPSSCAGKRLPELGYVNLPREVVVALTEVGLAWGAIDLGGESGDIMHFDCRSVRGSRGCP